MKATCTSKRFCSDISSQSMRTIYSPLDISKPLFKATQIPKLFSFRNETIRLSLAALFAIITADSSVLPSSIMTNSKSLYVCPNILSMASCRYCAPLYTGINTLTFIIYQYYL